MISSAASASDASIVSKRNVINAIALTYIDITSSPKTKATIRICTENDQITTIPASRAGPGGGGAVLLSMCMPG